jgi:RNA polymerase sigma-70 factor (ECF subfamily)
VVRYVSEQLRLSPISSGGVQTFSLEGAVPSKPPEVRPLESSAHLLARAREGSGEARQELVVRYLPAIQRFAHGRLPSRTRSVIDTGDLVQMALVRALERLEHFEPRREGAFLSYLRQIVINQVRDEARRVAARPRHVELPEDLAHQGRTPLEDAIGNEALENYEAALSRLSDQHREAVILRLELGFSYEQIAEALERPSAGAARMVVFRGMERLAAMMRERMGRSR